MSAPIFSLEGVQGLDITGIPQPTVGVASAEERLSKVSSPSDLVNAVGNLVRARKASGGIGRAEVLMGKLVRTLSTLQSAYERDFEDPRNFNTLANLELSTLRTLLPEVIGDGGLAQVYHVFKDEGCGTHGIRQLLELYTAQICKTSLEPFRPRTPCWICGFPMSGRTGSGAFTLQCGHILPLSQSHYFTDLANSGDKDLANACYGYAHKLCSTLRDDRRFLRIGSGKRYELVSDAELKAFLRHLYEHGESRFMSDGRVLKDAIGPNYTKWATERLPIVKARIQALLTKVQSCPERAFLLGGLVACSPTGAGKKTRRRRRGGRTRRRV
jgi:hypothetical protein